MFVDRNITVDVLLATYNGESFLREQIDSILSQSYDPLRVMARDDGSKDGTRAILEEYAQRFPERFRLLPASPATGSAQQNFLRLIQAAVATPGVEYLAFADQDDVWLPEKIALEMDAMHRLETSVPAGQPLLVFSDLAVVDQELRMLDPSMWARSRMLPDNAGRLQRILVQNVVTGCTAVINRPLAVLASQMPHQAYMHDWWIALLASVFGSTAFVTQPTVLYRQHGGNLLGATSLAPPRGIPKWRYHGPRRAQWELSARQAEALLAVHGASIPDQKRDVIERLLRCETHPNPFVRAWSWLRGGFFLTSGLRPNLAMLWYLWDMKAAKANGAAGPQ
jgi:glycosyltransferase involved in cell wall biosynthesis